MTRLPFLLLLPVLLAAGCGGGATASSGSGSVTAAGPASAQTAEVDGKDTLRFTPSEIRAQPGTLALTFANTGQVPHNLVFDDPALGKTSTVDGGTRQVVSLKIDRPGTYTFSCTFHPRMTGKVVVP